MSFAFSVLEHSSNFRRDEIMNRLINWVKENWASVIHFLIGYVVGVISGVIIYNNIVDQGIYKLILSIGLGALIGCGCYYLIMFILAVIKIFYEKKKRKEKEKIKPKTPRT